MTLERIVVRVPNWLGDAILSLAALRDVRRHYPDAQIEALARASVAELYGAVPEIDSVQVSRGVREDAARLRGGFDLAILFPNSFGSAVAPFWARVPERWGYATDGRRLLLTRAAPPRHRGQSQVYYYRAMLTALGMHVSDTPDTSLTCPSAWRAAAVTRLGPGPWVAVSPGAAYGSAKRWAPERFAEAAETVARARGAGVAVLGTAAERALGDGIARRLSVPTRVLCGETTLADLVAVLAEAELLLCNDSGAMHVAAALGTPVVAVFGPTDWRETAPVGSRCELVREPAHCAPCLLRECPLDHRCMERVGVERVVAAAQALLGRAGTAS